MSLGLQSVGTVRAPGTKGAYGEYNYAGGAGAAVVTVGGVGFAGVGYISTVAAFAAAAGATVQIDAGPVIPVPVGGSVSLDIEGGIFCDASVANTHTFTFVGTSGYIVDWLVM